MTVYSPQSTEGRWVKVGDASVFKIGRAVAEIKKKPSNGNYHKATIFFDGKEMQTIENFSLRRVRNWAADWVRLFSGTAKKARR